MRNTITYKQSNRRFEFFTDKTSLARSKEYFLLSDKKFHSDFIRDNMENSKLTPTLAKRFYEDTDEEDVKIFLKMKWYSAWSI